MDHALEHHKTYIGKKATDLPTPSLIISLPIVTKNIERLHQDVQRLGLAFRPHVKTLKTIEVTRLMLGGGKYRSIVASTLSEIRGALPLVQEGVLDECLYGLPVYPGCLPALAELRKSIRIQLMVDNEQQVAALEAFDASLTWDAFIKIDVGSHRAGVALASPALKALVERVDKSPSVHLIGFYCHAGHSYAGRTPEEAEKTLHDEVQGVVQASRLLPSDRQIKVSVGSTPTAHMVSKLKANLPPNVQLELHAGNFPANDLQQVSTAVVTEQDQAVRVAAEVCSVYEERNEVLLNAGVIALSREASAAYPGFGRVADQPDWAVVRLSQEHGIVGTQNGQLKASDTFRVGQKVQLFCNHACITAAAFFAYYVVDESDTVVETWVPWKGW